MKKISYFALEVSLSNGAVLIGVNSLHEQAVSKDSEVDYFFKYSVSLAAATLSMYTLGKEDN